MDSERTAWARVGHRLGERARRLLDQPAECLVLEAPDGYVQWHGEEARCIYAEAASGWYDGRTRSPAQVLQLCRLGWSAPGAGWGGSSVQNWSLRWSAPVPIYTVTLLTVHTLRRVFAADPRELLEVLCT